MPLVDFSRLSSASRPYVFAHRGASRLFRENTLEAFEAAIAMGADGIECDVRRTRDGVMIIHHDARVTRSSRWIRNLDYEQVLRLSRRRGYHVPTLEEALRRCTERVALDIELKEPGYESDVAALALGRYHRRNVLFTSFHPAVVAALRDAAPSANIGLIVGLMAPGPARGQRLRGISAADVRRQGAGFIAPNHRLVTARFAEKMSGEGLPIVAWTVNYRSAALRLARRGAAVIVTDAPDKILAALRAGAMEE